MSLRRLQVAIYNILVVVVVVAAVQLRFLIDRLVPRIIKRGNRKDGNK